MEEALKKAAAANDEASFAAARATARAHGGATALRAHLLAAGHIDEDGMLTTGVKPFNVFARVASGKMSQPNMEEENAALGAAYAERFVVASNLPAADKDWASTAPEQIGKVSMGERHRFLTTRNLSWEWFNVLAFGLEGDATSLREAIATLEAMQAAARAFAKGTPKWSESPERLGMFFHCFPNNSVQGLHMHLVDLGATGPTFDHFSYKNLPATAVLKVLRDELAQATGAQKASGPTSTSSGLRGAMSLRAYMPHSNISDPVAFMPHHFLAVRDADGSTGDGPRDSAPSRLRTHMPHAGVADPDALMPHHFLAKQEVSKAAELPAPAELPPPAASKPAVAASAAPISLGQPASEEAGYMAVLKLKTRLFFKLTFSRFGCM